MQNTNYTTLLDTLKETNVKLVVVSKYRSVGQIRPLYNQGQRLFGESRVQELQDKKDELPDDIQWHFIGHLQTNKVKYITEFIDLIHSGDSLRLLETINKEGAKIERKIPVLLQFKIAQEEAKYGLTQEVLQDFDPKNFPYLHFKGVMGMATYTDDETQVRKEFTKLYHIFNTLKNTHFASHPDFSEISMGMSGDYPLAIAAGSTMLRVGSLVFED